MKKRNLLGWHLLPAVGVLLIFLSSGSAFGFPGGSSSRFFSPPSLTHQVFQYVEWKYVDPQRSQPDNLLEGAFRTLETRYPEILIDWDRPAGEVTVRVDEERATFTLAENFSYGEAATLIEETLSFIAPLLDDDVEAKLLRYMTLNGALAELDPHSNVFGQKHYKDFKVRTSGSFGGIGFTFGVQEGDLTIISPIPDTPADRAGLQSGDKILYIDGEPTTNMGTDVAVGKMRGEPGTEVTLTIGREGWSELRDFPIVREIIHIVSVEKNSLEGDGEAPVIHVSIKNFQENTAAELRKALADADSPEIAGVIIDLRNNPGGLLQQAIEVSDGFLDSGVIVSTRSRDNQKETRNAGDTDIPFTKKPVVVLINRGSASASEIVAGALQDSRALVIGRTSFGKGSVQQAYQLMDGGGLLLTVSQYLTPGDVSIQSIGIQPDIVVDPLQVEKGNLRLSPLQGHTGEANLENAFNDWGNAKRKAEARLEYLKSADTKDDARGIRSTSREEKIAALKSEFEVRLARRILGAAAGNPSDGGRDALLEAGRKVVNALDLSEKAIVSKAMSDVGVDWSVAEDFSGDPKLSLIFPEELTLKAGTTSRLTLSVKNEGQGTAFQVWGDSESDNPILKNIDFAFGRIEPGEARSWTAEVEVPKAAEGRWDRMTVNLKTARLDDAGTFAGGALTKPMTLPEFDYTYTLDDENSRDPSRSGDGRLEEGERARLLLKVRNRGQAASDAVEVNLHGLEDESLYLDEVRQRIEGIPPGESREVSLSFLVMEANEDGEVEVRITVTDREHGVFFADTLKFPTGAPYPRVQARVPPALVLHTDLSPSAAEEKVSIKLEVTDDEEVKDVYAYRGEKKIHYARNTKGGALFPLQIEVPLIEGTNRVVLFARDQKNITSQKILFIHRAGEGASYSEAISPDKDSGP